jgi:hypothetical protein
MPRMLDCLVNYFGLDENDYPVLRRYLCYHVMGGPGPTEESGVATITTLAASNNDERCAYCQILHTVEKGGPAAAVAKAIRYLDDYHRGMHVRKVQTEVRGPAEPWVGGALPPESVAELNPAPWR